MFSDSVHVSGRAHFSSRGCRTMPTSTFFPAATLWCPVRFYSHRVLTRHWLAEKEVRFVSYNFLGTLAADHHNTLDEHGALARWRNELNNMEDTLCTQTRQESG